MCGGETVGGLSLTLDGQEEVAEPSARLISPAAASVCTRAAVCLEVAGVCVVGGGLPAASVQSSAHCPPQNHAKRSSSSSAQVAPPARLLLSSKLSRSSVSFQALVESSPSSVAAASASRVFRRAVSTAPLKRSGIWTYVVAPSFSKDSQERSSNQPLFGMRFWSQASRTASSLPACMPVAASGTAMLIEASAATADSTAALCSMVASPTGSTSSVVAARFETQGKQHHLDVEREPHVVARTSPVAKTVRQSLQAVGRAVCG